MLPCLSSSLASHWIPHASSNDSHAFSVSWKLQSTVNLSLMFLSCSEIPQQAFLFFLDVQVLAQDDAHNLKLLIVQCMCTSGKGATIITRCSLQDGFPKQGAQQPLPVDRVVHVIFYICRLLIFLDLIVHILGILPFAR